MAKVGTYKQKLGKWGEDQACNYLEINRYEILARNYRFERAEIDLIASKNKVLIFVEVKVRKNAQFGMPETFASQNQRHRIRRAAEQFQIENKHNGFIRFDIVSILGKPEQFEILHLKDAF